MVDFKQKKTTIKETECFAMQEFQPIKEGKVREIYDNGDSLIMVATDRISAFDVILKNKVTNKGKVLTQMSKFWFDYTRDVLPNHMLSVDTKDMPEFFQQPQFEGKCMKCRKLTMLPIECIVRGYITGSGWASYQKTGKVCGIQLPEGLKESEKLPEPIYTPSTKAEIGDHDENISYEQSITVLEKQFPGHGEEYATKLRDYTIALYKKCAEYATRCSPPTPPASGRWRATKPATASPPSTSSSSATGSRPTPTATMTCRRMSSIRPSRSTSKPMRC